MRGLREQEPSFKQPSRKLSWQFSSASLHPKAGTGENDRYADGASNLRGPFNNEVQQKDKN